jgi:hypothetical protein
MHTRVHTYMDAYAQADEVCHWYSATVGGKQLPPHAVANGGNARERWRGHQCRGLGPPRPAALLCRLPRCAHSDTYTQRERENTHT